MYLESLSFEGTQIAGGNKKLKARIEKCYKFFHLRSNLKEWRKSFWMRRRISKLIHLFLIRCVFIKIS